MQDHGAYIGVPIILYIIYQKKIMVLNYSLELATVD